MVDKINGDRQTSLLLILGYSQKRNATLLGGCLLRIPLLFLESTVEKSYPAQRYFESLSMLDCSSLSTSL